MNILRINKQYRNLVRYRDIIAVLMKYGFGEILDQLHIWDYLWIARHTIAGRGDDVRPERLTFGQRVKLALEELGPTFVKLGQVLSTRPYLLPADMLSELAGLQDRVAPLEFSVIEKQLAAELPVPAPEVFASVDPVPVAAGSIAQVHRAVLLDGTRVVIKVQRPGIERTISADMDILQDFAGLLERSLEQTRQYRPPAVVRELRRSMANELNFLNEAQNMEQFRVNFSPDSHVHVPVVHWQYSTERLLVMEEIAGVKISDREGLAALGCSPRTVADRLGRAVLAQIFTHGFIHGDPHPGNIFVLAGNVIAWIDFGQMGRLDEDTRENLSDILVAVVNRDAGRLVTVFQGMGMLEEDADREGLKQELLELIDRYANVPLERIDMQRVMADVHALAVKYRISFPANLMFLAKTMTMYEAFTRTLDPEYDFIAQAGPFVRRFVAGRYSFGRLRYQALRMVRDYRQLLGALPGEAQAILTKLRRGEYAVDLHHRGLKDLIAELDRASNRISFSLIIAALIIGSSFIIQLDTGYKFMGYPVIGLAGYVLAAILGMWLVVNILRSRKL